ncbi:MAG: hypothetical protein ACXVEF_17740 [Polyangiales bacterium]
MRGLLRLHADAFVRGPAAPLFGLGVVAAIVLSPTGLDPRDVPHMLATGTFSRAITLIAFVVLMRASTRRMIFPPGATYVRASAIPRWTQMATIALFVALAQLPLPAVLLAGRAPLDALSVLACLSTACVATTFVEASLALALGWSSIAPLGIVLFPIALVRAYRAAPLRERARVRLRFPLFWPLQIVLAEVRSLGVVHLALAALPPWVGFLLVRLGDDRSERARSLAAVVAALSAAPLVFRVGGMVRVLRPMIRRAPVLVAVAIVATPSMAFAAGTQVMAHESVFPIALALVMLLVVVEDRIAARRRDVALTWTLIAIPLTVVFTLLSRARWTAVSLVLGALALALPEPEVRRADDR